jgi:hypothetical protein
MADTMNSTPKHVVSSTLENPRWNSTVIDGHRRSSTVAVARSWLPEAVGSCTHCCSVVSSTRCGCRSSPSRSVAGCGCFPDDQVKLGFSLANQLTFAKGVLAFEFTTAI